jgi:hypothetical protein
MMVTGARPTIQRTDFEHSQAGVGVDAEGFHDALVGCRRPYHDGQQPVVGDEVDAVEVGVGLDFGGSVASRATTAAEALPVVMGVVSSVK